MADSSDFPETARIKQNGAVAVIKKASRDAVLLDPPNPRNPQNPAVQSRFLPDR
jgi:hypothetical protein